MTANTLLFANNVATTLAASIVAGSTSCTVAPGTGAEFPNPGAGQYFIFTFLDAATGLIREICWCTARTGDTMTIVRGQEGTTAQNWSTGDLVQMLCTAGTMQALLQESEYNQGPYDYVAAAGTANALTVAYNNPVLAYTDGLRLLFKASAANTGAATLNVNGLGAVALLNSYAVPLIAGEIGANVIYEVTYYAALPIGGTPAFVISSTPNFLPTLRFNQGPYDYVAAAGTNTITATFANPPVIADGLKLRFRAANTNTGAVTFNPNGLGAVAVLNNNLSAMTGGEIQANYPVEVTYSSALAKWVMTTHDNSAITQPQILAAVRFNSTGTIVGSAFNVSGVTHSATGQYAVTFTSAISANGIPVTSTGVTQTIATWNTYGTTSINVYAQDSTNGTFLDRECTLVIYS